MAEGLESAPPAAKGHAARRAASSARDLALLAVVAGAIACIALLTVRFSAPTPGQLDHARVFAATGREPMPFYQTGYVVMLAAGLLLGGERGIFALQAIAYIADVLLAYVLVISSGGSRRAAVTAALVIAVHPYLVLNVKRIVDSNLAIPALFLATLAIIAVWLSKAQRLRSALMAGLAIGFAMLARSNFAPLVILMIGVFAVRGNWRRGVFAAAIAMAIVLTGNRLAGGYWRPSPTEGGYTFYLGANPFTADALIRYYNPEASLAAAATADKIDFGGLPVYTFANSHEALFWRLGIKYIVHHPFEYLWLGVLKLITLLRPDYRQVGHSMTASASILIAVQTLLALIVPLWVALRLMLRRQVGVFDGIWAIPIVAILLLAVVLVAGDPRYRLSIEVLAIIDAAWCYDAWRRGGWRRANQ